MNPYRLFWPIIRLFNPEVAHSMALMALRLGLWPSAPRISDPVLTTRLWGHTFSSPVGLASGFDKDAEIIDATLKLGFSFTEVGSVTPQPQSGNAKPRLFRLEEDAAIINRMGFNNKGAEVMRCRLAMRSKKEGIVGVNLGKNRETQDAITDYCLGIKALAPFADYVAINVSSPNTPGLQNLQKRDELTSLLSEAKKTLAQVCGAKAPPLVLKISPDLTEQDKEDIAAILLDLQLDGLIATNTTIVRSDTLRSAYKNETGGLSGRPLFDLSTCVLADMYRLTEGKIPLIGCGGIESGRDAYIKIRAGASLIQCYSALVYHGPSLVVRIIRELADLLRKDGFDSAAAAVGADHQ